MNDVFIAPVIVGIICATIYGLFELFARRRERIAFIEKLAEIKGMGQIEGKIDFTFGKPFSTWALRGGCLLIGLGIGLLFSYMLLVLNMHGTKEGVNLHDMEEIICCGSVLLFGGIGLLIAFILEYKYFKKK